MSRIGKIARLPHAVREELNQRLLDGEAGNRLVEWLNGRPEVQAVMKDYYEGNPINEPNLTQWVQGGFEDWRRQQEALQVMSGVVEESSAVAETVAGRSLVDRAADMAAVAIVQELHATRRM